MPPSNIPVITIDLTVTNSNLLADQTDSPKKLRNAKNDDLLLLKNRAKVLIDR